MKHRTGREFFGHKAEFDEGLHAVRQQRVVNLINVSEVVDGIALRVFVIDAVLILENGMESHITKASDVVYPIEIAAIAVAQGEVCASRSEHLLPEMRKGSGGSGEIHADHFVGRRGSLRRHDLRQQEKASENDCHSMFSHEEKVGRQPRPPPDGKELENKPRL